MSYLLESDFTPIDHNMAPNQKLDIAEVWRIAPDAIEVIHVTGSLEPNPQFALYLLKNNTAMVFEEAEIEPSLCADEFASLKQEYKFLKWTMQGTPFMPALEAEETE